MGTLLRRQRDYPVCMTHPPRHPNLLANFLRPLLWIGLIAMPLASHAIEEPAYDVLRAFGNVELRQYAPYVVAEVVIDGAAEDAGNAAFPILAGYIFGKNKGEKKFDMTAPVTQTAAPVKLPMTAPVTQAAVPGGGHLIQFVLPKGVTLGTAPEPLDPRVRLREELDRQWAAIRYSGTWSQANYDAHLALLRAALVKEGVATNGEPVLARYNAPFTPWFLRRNEIWLALR
jgi:SOUL heme-binding protein